MEGTIALDSNPIYEMDGVEQAATIGHSPRTMSYGAAVSPHLGVSPTGSPSVGYSPHSPAVSSFDRNSLLTGNNRQIVPVERESHVSEVSRISELHTGS